jgi:hypothetical protein
MHRLMRAPFLSWRDFNVPGGGQVDGRPLLNGRRPLAKRLRGLLTCPWCILTQKSWCIPLIVLSVFFLSRPYPGIVRDAYIYMGRALADLDPDGIGRDLMFVNDGQFGFSLFRYLATAVAAVFGLAIAAKTLAFLGVLLWFWAAAFFARQFASGGAVWATLIFVCLLPASYGAPYPFSFAEPLAIPRPFAEALVLASLAALACGQTRLSLSCLILASLMHPLMALPGVSIFLIILGVERKPLFLLYTCVCAALLVGGAMGLPVLDRLFVAADPSLRSLYESRNPFLFPTRWPGESFPPLIVQAATMAIAAHFQQGRLPANSCGHRSGQLGWHRGFYSLWRLAFIAPYHSAATLAHDMGHGCGRSDRLGVCAIKLWPEGPGGRVVLAFLVLAWSFITQFLAALAGILALYLYVCQNRYASLLKARFVPAVWLFTLVVSAIWQIRLFGSAWQYFVAAPAHYGCLLLILVKCLLPLPLCFLATYLAIAKPRVAPGLKACFAVFLSLAAVLFWDQRTPGQPFVETGHPPAEIMQLIGEHKGEVLWVDGSAEAWYMLGRAQWATPLQGIPIIFSAALAKDWRIRTSALMNLRLADQKSFAPWSNPKGADRPVLSQDSVQRLCARGDAPAWIIAPIEHGTMPPDGLQMTLWQLPKPQFKLAKGDGDYVWQQIDAFGVIPCARQTQSQQFEERG